MGNHDLTIQRHWQHWAHKTRQTDVRENRRAFKNGQSKDTGNIIITGCTYNFMVVPEYQPLLRIIEVVHDRGMNKVGTIS